MIRIFGRPLAVAVSTLCLCFVPLRAQEPTPAADSTMEKSSGLETLEQRVRILERLIELEKEAAARSAADQNFQLKLRGYVHEDARYFEGDGHAGVNSFVLRRVRPVIEATA